MHAKNHWKQWVGRLVAACCTCWMLAGALPAYADAPAVTDFGGDTVYTVGSPAAQPTHYAVFLTLYEDGRQQWIVRSIEDDAVVSFRGDHGAWQLDHPLMWLLNMPVYIKQVPRDAMADSI